MEPPEEQRKDRNRVFKVAIIAMLAAIVASLFAGLYFLFRDGSSARTVRALTVRIALSILLFVILMIGVQSGLMGSG
ncbi:MAG TPA: twin transmembrane helix small protein [Rhodocyclaceae bacterium]|nr:twin transmembrane helix small protein [Rhodocyclaceae bacterium]